MAEQLSQNKNSQGWQRSSHDKELVLGEQGLLLFAPNLQSFGALPKHFSRQHIDEYDEYDDVGGASDTEQSEVAGRQSERKGQRQKQALHHQGHNVRSEEDVDLSDDSDEGGDNARREALFAQRAYDSLERAQNDNQSFPVRSGTDRSITKASSSRKLHHDQGQEGYDHNPSSHQKESDSFLQRQRQRQEQFHRNETFAAGSRAELSVSQSEQNLPALPSQTTLNSFNQYRDSQGHLLPSMSQTSETWRQSQGTLLPALSRSQAQRVLASGISLSANQLSQLQCLCKDVLTLMINLARLNNTTDTQQQVQLFTAQQDQIRQSMEGLFQVLQWRLDNAITPHELTQIFTEWQRSNGNADSPKLGPNFLKMAKAIPQVAHQATTDGQDPQRQTLERLRFDESMIYLVQIGAKYNKGSLGQFVVNAPRMLELLRSEFNSQLLSEGIVDDLWLQVVERLYAQLDFEQGHLAGSGALKADRLQYFLLTLLLNEIKEESWEKIPLIVQRQTLALMTNMRAVSGHVTLRDFKTYLVLEGVRSLTDIQVLYEHFEIVMRSYRRIQQKQKLSSQNNEESKDLSQSDADQSLSSSLARQVYENVKKMMTASSNPGDTNKSHVGKFKNLFKGTASSMPQDLAKSSFQSLTYAAQACIYKSVGSTPIYDFLSASEDAELGQAMALWRFASCKMLQLGASMGLIAGTSITPANQVKLKQALISDYLEEQQTSSSEIETPANPQSAKTLATFFDKVISTYSNANTETLLEMCRYLNDHIVGTQDYQPPTQILKSLQGSTRSLMQNAHEESAASEHFSVQQYSSNAGQPYGSEIKSPPTGGTTPDASPFQQDSRPSFGKDYFTSFVQQAPIPNRGQGQIIIVESSSANKVSNPLALPQADSSQGPYMDKMQSVAIFGEYAEITPQESTIKLQEQDDSSFLLKQMVGLGDDSNQNNFNTSSAGQIGTGQSYASVPNHYNGQADNQRVAEMLLKDEMRVPLTTKNRQAALDTSQGMSKMVENIEEPPSQFIQDEPEERLPKFKIDLKMLQQMNLARKAQVTADFAMAESTGVGLMLSQRQREVVKIPKLASRVPQKASKVVDQTVERKGQKTLQNVKSISDVLSSLSATSPKFQAKMVGNESNKLLSIESPAKFVNDQSLSSAAKDKNNRLPSNAYTQARGQPHKRQASYDSNTLHQNSDQLGVVASNQNLLYHAATETPSFSFQDQQSSSRILSNNPAQYAAAAMGVGVVQGGSTPQPVGLRENQTVFSMKTDDTLVKTQKNTQSMSIQPLNAASHQQLANSTSMLDNLELLKPQRSTSPFVKSGPGRGILESSRLLSRNLNQKRSLTQMSQQATSPRSTLSALLPSQGYKAPTLTNNRSSFLGSYHSGLQKVKQRATSQASLRRIESYSDVLNRLKSSVIHVLAETNTKHKQQNVSTKTKGRSKSPQPPSNKGLVLSSANPAQLDFLRSLGSSSKVPVSTAYLAYSGSQGQQPATGGGVTARGGQGLTLQQSPSKQGIVQQTQNKQAKKRPQPSHGASNKASGRKESGFFSLEPQQTKAQVVQIGNHTGFQVSSEQVAQKTLSTSFQGASSILSKVAAGSVQQRGAKRGALITQYDVGAGYEKLQGQQSTASSANRQQNAGIKQSNGMGSSAGRSRSTTRPHATRSKGSGAAAGVGRRLINNLELNRR